MKLLVLNGPNLNFLGIREPDIYGTMTYDNLVEYLTQEAEKRNVTLTFFQSNHEGALVDAIQGTYQKQDGIIINPAAYTHTSVAILDALKAVNLPAA
ncbi:MAG: type II 3-dehydroquinate dehydratase, partial [Ruthenibacterium sp.]